jgi:Spx/MgsR family transcriptional regulator
MVSIPTVYGIANCDTIRKARAWLQAQGVAYVWHDFKKQGVPAALLAQWLQQLGREELINRKGTTWRRLDAAVQAGVTDDASAAALMLVHPSVIKRPLVDWGQGRATLGFDPLQWMQMQAATNAPD